jgi:DNA invertase Pin-like site-specific DNA recombinase
MQKKKDNLKCAIYCRVSTEDQNPKHQENALLEYANDNNYEVFRVYTDVTSGVNQSRPALNDLMFDARAKKFNVVIVWKLDRLGRSLQHLLGIVHEWDIKGIDFVCITQMIDTTTGSGRLQFHILGAVAEFERTLISERTKEGLNTAKAKGKVLGRPKGSKDKGPRSRSGYYARYSKKRGV